MTTDQNLVSVGSASSVNWRKVFDTHLFDFFLDHLGHFAKAESHRDPELYWYYTGIPNVFLNGIIHNDFGAGLSEAELSDKIKTAMQPFKERQTPMIWMTGPSTQPANLDEQLLKHGLIHAETWVRMTVDLTTLEARPLPPGLEIRTGEDIEFLRDWLVPVSPAFDVSEEAGEMFIQRIVELRSREHLPWYHFLAYMDGKPVSTVTIVPGHDGFTSVEMVATLPEYRRRGIGKAVSIAGFLKAREMGFQTLIVHSQPPGYEFYRSLGFKDQGEVTKLHVWTGEEDYQPV